LLVLHYSIIDVLQRTSLEPPLSLDEKKDLQRMLQFVDAIAVKEDELLSKYVKL
jgi:hypothetical protein